MKGGAAMETILPGVYRLRGLIAGNVYAIEDPDGVTLIDASIPPSGAKILDQVAKLGHPPTAIKRILITHAHPDHVGGLPEIRRHCDAQVMAAAAEAPVIRGEIPIPQTPPHRRRGLARLISLPETRLPPVQVDRILEDGELLPEVLGGLQAVATPGHAPGHLAFWHPRHRLLFCGDVIFRLPNLRLPYSFLTVDMDENKRSIAKLAALEPAIVCFGHGRPLVEGAAAAIRRFAGRVSLD